MKRLRSHIGQVAVGLLGVPTLLLCPSASAAVFDYSATFKNVLLTVELSTVHYRVFDTSRSVFANGEDGSGNIANLDQTDGVVYWSDGSRLYCRIYDHFLGQWMKTNVVSGAVSQLTSKDGVVTWVSSGFVYHVAYDATRGAWMGDRIAFSGTPSNLQTKNGVVAWINQTAGFYSVYDPLQGRWINDSVSSGSPPAQMSLEDGVVAWSNGTTVFCRTFAYHSTTGSGAWRSRDITTGGVGNLKNNGGVVAWTATAVIHYAIYDPNQNSWQIGEANTGVTTNLSVSHGTVTWTSGQAGEDDFIRGYDATMEPPRWISGATKPVAIFATSDLTGGSPSKVYLIDMSLGASGWCWTFGEGDVSARRSPLRRLEGAFNRVTLAVSGPDERSDTTSRFLILGDGGNGGSATMQSANFALSETIHTVDGLFQAVILGTVGQTLLIERSNDLELWEAVATVTNVEGTVEFIDTTTTDGRRYYRVRALQP